MNNSSRRVFCAECKNELDPNTIGPCPRCGANKKDFKVEISDSIKLKVSLNRKSTRQFYENNTIFIFLVVLITIASSIIGVIFAGYIGILIGLVLGGISSIIGAKAQTKVKEIREIQG